MNPSSTRIHLLIIGKPSTAAKLSTANTRTAQSRSFLTIGNMSHFDFYLKLIGISLDQFTEIHPRFSRVEKYRLSTIALNLNVGNLHLKIQ